MKPGLAPFYCSGPNCGVWLRERPPLTEKLVVDAFRDNFSHDVHGWRDESGGKLPLRAGVLTVTTTERISNPGDSTYADERTRQHRFCPTCAAVVKDALLQLGFHLYD